MTLRERAPNLIGDGPSGPLPHVHVHLPNTYVNCPMFFKEIFLLFFVFL